jgi:hypothetical protein
LISSIVSVGLEAHEDDAERAVRAGLGSIDAVGRLDVKSLKLQARVGIATSEKSIAALKATFEPLQRLDVIVAETAYIKATLASRCPKRLVSRSVNGSPVALWQPPVTGPGNGRP